MGLSVALWALLGGFNRWNWVCCFYIHPVQVALGAPAAAAARRAFTTAEAEEEVERFAMRGGVFVSIKNSSAAYEHHHRRR